MRMLCGSVEVAQHIQFLLKAMGAKRCLELGCFTGYTTLSMALAIPNDGQVVTCDINENFVQRGVWKEAGVDHKVLYKLNNSLLFVNRLNNLDIY